VRLSPVERTHPQQNRRRPPLLQGNPVADMTEMREREDRELNQAAWIDRQQGTVRLPVADAIDHRRRPRRGARGGRRPDGSADCCGDAGTDAAGTSGTAGTARTAEREKDPLNGLRGFAASAGLALMLAGAASGSPNGSVIPSSEMPGVLKSVGYDQRIGEKVPLDVPWRDEHGRAVTLGDYLGHKPAVLVMAYYHCPMLCDLVLQGVETGLKPLSLDPGREFDVIVAGIDPNETPALAAAKKREILARYGGRAPRTAGTSSPARRTRSPGSPSRSASATSTIRSATSSPTPPAW